MRITRALLVRWAWAFAIAASAPAACSRSTSPRDGEVASGADLALSEVAVTFGGVPVGSSAAQSFEARNTGRTLAGDVSLTLADGTAFSVVDSTCGSPTAKVTVAPGERCTFTVVFAPTTAGARSDALTIAFTGPGSTAHTRTATLSGTGEPTAAGLAISPASHAFGPVSVGASSAPFPFTVTNSGGATATNVRLALATGAQFSVAANACGTAVSRVALAAGATCTFQVTYAPTAAAAASDVVTVTYDTAAITGETRTAAVSGVGQSATPIVTVAPSSGRAFGNVTLGTSSAPQTFTVANVGTGPATGVRVGLAAGAQFSLDAGGCGTAAAPVRLAAGAGCTFTVTFTPTSAGAQADTVTVTYDTPTASGLTAAAPLSGAGLPPTTHGLSIPGAHPRLWYDAARLERARSWYRSHPFTPSGDMWSGAGFIDNATRGLLNAEPAQCRTAIAWALGAAASLPIPMSGVACDDCRWFGEQIILTYDFCFDEMTVAERASLVASTNSWILHWMRALPSGWGDVPMHQNNYYWGYVRNELEWALTSYEDNTVVAEALLDDVLTHRLAQDFDPATLTDSRGGVGQEGSQYGPYIAAYATVPFVSAGLLGRDLLAETGFWREAVYAVIYSTTPAPTTLKAVSGTGYTFFPSDDDEGWTGGFEADATCAGFMTAAAMRWADSPVGAHARQWLATTGARPYQHIRSVDPGGTGTPFTSLPRDYYASGARYLWGRNAWSPSSTAFFLQLGDRDTRLLGHSHVDWGTWQLWRNGRFVSRESVGYSDTIAGYGGAGTVGTDTALAHNALLVDGAGSSSSPWSSGAAVVRRLESRDAYAYADVDLTPASENAHVVHLEREFVFVRSLETLVVLDRVESSAAADTKTFLAHCETGPATTATGATCTTGTQALVLTTLVPASPRIRAVAEGGVGQYRVEVETSPGTPQSYILTVLQAKDAGAAALSPSVEDTGAAFVVTLDASTRVTFAKGMASSGGSVTVAGATTPLRSDVQPMVVTDDGPVWK